MLVRKGLPSAMIMLGLCAGSASGQVSAVGQGTTLMAHVSESATLTLPNHGTSFLRAGNGMMAGPFGVVSHVGENESRELRVTWSWLPSDSAGTSSVAIARGVRLPRSGTVQFGMELPLPEIELRRDSGAVRMKVESFEL